MGDKVLYNSTAAEVGVRRKVLQHITKLENIVSDDHNLWYKNADRLIQIQTCKVNVVDVLKDHLFAPNDCTIDKGGSKNCKTCKIRITNNS